MISGNYGNFCPVKMKRALVSAVKVEEWKRLKAERGVLAQPEEAAYDIQLAIDISACRFFKLQTNVTDPTLCSPVMVISVLLKAVSSVGPINPNKGFFLFGSVASAKKTFPFFFLIKLLEIAASSMAAILHGKLWRNSYLWNSHTHPFSSNLSYHFAYCERSTFLYARNGFRLDTEVDGAQWN